MSPKRLYFYIVVLLATILTSCSLVLYRRRTTRVRKHKAKGIKSRFFMSDHHEDLSGYSTIKSIFFDAPFSNLFHGLERLTIFGKQFSIFETRTQAGGLRLPFFPSSSNETANRRRDLVVQGDGRTYRKFVQAVYQGDVPSMKALVKRYKVENTDKKKGGGRRKVDIINRVLDPSTGDTALVIAAKNNSMPMIQFLLRQPGLELNAITDARNNTALWVAEEHKNYDIVEALLQDKRLNVNRMHTRYDNELLYATRYKKTAIGVHLARHERVDVNARDGEFNMTALHWAVKTKDVYIFKTLIKNKRIDINSQDKLGFTVLMKAIVSEDYQFVRLLLSHPRTDLYAQDCVGRSTLVYAVLWKRQKIVKMLLDDKRMVTGDMQRGIVPAYHIALEVQQKLPALIFTKHPKTDLNFRYSRGRTPAMIAARSPSLITVLKELISRSSKVLPTSSLSSSQKRAAVDLEQTDADGMTAFMHAIRVENLDAVASLLEAYDNKYPLDTFSNAIKNLKLRYYGKTGTNRLDIEEMGRLEYALLKNTVYNTSSPNPGITGNGTIPIPRGKHITEAELKKLNQAELNAKLTHATLHGRSVSVSALLVHEADPNSVTRTGHSALLIACNNAFESIATDLIIAGAQVDMVPKAQDTALRSASEKGLLSTVQLILRKMEKNADHADHSQARADVLAHINYKNFNGVTALMSAAEIGHVKIVTELLRAQADTAIFDRRNRTALILAAASGRSSVIDAFVAADKEHSNSSIHRDLRKEDMYQQTPLMIASSLGHIQTIRSIADADASIVNHPNSMGTTPLFSAAANNQWISVQVLLSLKASLDYANAKGRTVLMVAAQNGHMKVVNLLLVETSKKNENSGISPDELDINRADMYGKTALIYAAEWKHSEVVDAFIYHGADKDKADTLGKTALIHASIMGHTKAVRTLLRSGADFNKQDMSHSTAMWYASVNGYTEVTKLLKARNATLVRSKSDGIRDAVQMGNELKVRDYIIEECEINLEYPPKGKTLLMFAAEGRRREGRIVSDSSRHPVLNSLSSSRRPGSPIRPEKPHLGIMEALLQADADIDMIAKGAQPMVTALIITAHYGHMDALRLLLKRGAQPNLMTNEGNTALTTAAARGHEDAVRILLEVLTDEKRKEDQGFKIGREFTVGRALRMAAQNGHLACVNVLIQTAGMDATSHGNRGTTVLYDAAERGHVDVVRALLSQNYTHVDVNQTNSDKTTALMGAAREGHLQVIRVLLEAKEDARAQDNQGQTAVQIAEAHGHELVVAVIQGFIDGDFAILDMIFRADEWEASRACACNSLCNCGPMVCPLSPSGHSPEESRLGRLAADPYPNYIRMCRNGNDFDASESLGSEFCRGPFCKVFALRFDAIAPETLNPCELPTCPDDCAWGGAVKREGQCQCPVMFSTSLCKSVFSQMPIDGDLLELNQNCEESCYKLSEESEEEGNNRYGYIPIAVAIASFLALIIGVSIGMWRSYNHKRRYVCPSEVVTDQFPFVRAAKSAFWKLNLRFTLGGRQTLEDTRFERRFSVSDFSVSDLSVSGLSRSPSFSSSRLTFPSVGFSDVFSCADTHLPVEPVTNKKKEEGDVPAGRQASSFAFWKNPMALLGIHFGRGVVRSTEIIRGNIPVTKEKKEEGDAPTRRQAVLSSSPLLRKDPIPVWVAPPGFSVCAYGKAHTAPTVCESTSTPVLPTMATSEPDGSDHNITDVDPSLDGEHLMLPCSRPFRRASEGSRVVMGGGPSPCHESRVGGMTPRLGAGVFSGMTPCREMRLGGITSRHDEGEMRLGGITSCDDEGEMMLGEMIVSGIRFRRHSMPWTRSSSLGVERSGGGVVHPVHHVPYPRLMSKKTGETDTSINSLSSSNSACDDEGQFPREGG